MTRLSPLLAVLLAACSGDSVVRELRERPTIVSLNPCSDAILAEVTAPGQLLAISHYSKNPASSSMEPTDAVRYAATGGTVEEVLALAPDVVVASAFLAPATKAALEDMGLQVVTFGGTASVEDSVAQVRALAELAGDREAGERLVSEIEAALAAAASGDASEEAALWQPGGIVPGEASLVSDMLRRTGFSSYPAARGMQQADYLSLEQIVADPPDVLLVAGREASQQHPVLDELGGMRREHFDTSLIYCGGPTIIRAAERLADIRAAALVRVEQGRNPPARASRLRAARSARYERN